MPTDLKSFGLTEMLRCSVALRHASSGARSMEDAAKRIRKAGKAPGILVGEADGKRCLDMGYLFVAVGADTGTLVRGADALAAKFK